MNRQKDTLQTPPNVPTFVCKNIELPKTSSDWTATLQYTPQTKKGDKYLIRTVWRYIRPQEDSYRKNYAGSDGQAKDQYGPGLILKQNVWSDTTASNIVCNDCKLQNQTR